MGNSNITQNWYTDDDINQLLKFSSSKCKDVAILTSMLGTDWYTFDETGEIQQRGNVLKDNLAQFKPLATTSKVVVPVNVNANHWVLLYITFEAGIPVTAYYFDPKGHHTPDDIIHAVRTVYPHVEILNLNSQVQADNNNNDCGVWLVEAAKSFVERGALPTCDINQARQEHQTILNSIASAKKSCKELSKLGLFKANERHEVLKTIESQNVRSALENYLTQVNQRVNNTTDVDELLAICLQNEELENFVHENQVKKFRSV